MTFNVMLVSREKVLCIPSCGIFSQALQEQRVALLYLTIPLCWGAADSVIKKEREPVAKISTCTKSRC